MAGADSLERRLAIAEARAAYWKSQTLAARSNTAAALFGRDNDGPRRWHRAEADKHEKAEAEALAKLRELGAEP